LKVVPGNPTDPLRINLQTVTLSEAEDSYGAISYVWGDTKETVIIICRERR
jgi:hypothetical protein